MTFFDTRACSKGLYSFLYLPQSGSKQKKKDEAMNINERKGADEGKTKLPGKELFAPNTIYQEF